MTEPEECRNQHTGGDPGAMQIAEERSSEEKEYGSATDRGPQWKPEGFEGHLVFDVLSEEKEDRVRCEKERMKHPAVQA